MTTGDEAALLTHNQRQLNPFTSTSIVLPNCSFVFVYMLTSDLSVSHSTPLLHHLLFVYLHLSTLFLSLKHFCRLSSPFSPPLHPASSFLVSSPASGEEFPVAGNSLMVEVRNRMSCRGEGREQEEIREERKQRDEIWRGLRRRGEETREDTRM